MKNRLIAVVGGAAAALVLSPLGAAQAADHTVTAMNFVFVPPAVVVAEGDTLTLDNRDSAPHNVISYARRAGGPNGRMFWSETVRLSSTPVLGVDTTPAGAYPFYCSIHPQMNGVLVVHPAA